MSETWRRKQNYAPRVLIDTARVLDPQFSDSMLCITGAQLEMLRNLTQYLHRRSTFVSEQQDGYYLCATNEEWDALQAEVAELEETLMGCPEFTAALEDLVAQVACICSAASRATRDGSALPALIEDGLDNGKLAPEDLAGGTTPVDEDRCALAQLNYWLAWELLTEVIQPLQDVASDILMPMAMVAIAAMCGTTIVGLPAGALLAFLWNLAEIWEAGEMINLQNTFRAYEDELICAVYQGLAINYDEAHALAKIEIDKMADTSAIDKLVFSFLFSPWALKVCQTAKTAGTDWAIANVEAGRCDDCLLIVGSDWYAEPIVVPNGDIILDHSTPGSYWASGAVCGTIRAATICGLVLECVELTGCTCEMASVGEACGGLNLLGVDGEDLHLDDLYYVFKDFTHNEGEAIAALAPGAVPYEHLYQRTGPGTWQFGAHLGYNCTGTAVVRVKYIVYEGAP